LTEERYDLRESKRSIRELYPVLLDAHGNVIDGFHRLEADPAWKTERLEHIRTPTQLALARIIANTHRRMVSREERAEQIEELARALMEHDGVPKTEIVQTIAELTTFSKVYVYSLLPDEFKLRPGAGGPKRVKLSLTQDVTVAGMPRSTLYQGWEEPSVTVPAGTPGPDADAETSPAAEGMEAPAHLDQTSPPMTPVRDEGAPVPTIQEYIADYFSRYPLKDRDNIEILIWKLTREYGLTKAEASRHVNDYLKPPKPKTREKIKPEAPQTTRCPLCNRAGADLLLLQMKIETGELPPKVAEWLTEALQR